MKVKKEKSCMLIDAIIWAEKMKIAFEIEDDDERDRFLDAVKDV